MIKLGELDPGRRFLMPYSGRTGVVVRQGEMGTSVRLDGRERKVKGKSKRTDQAFEFTAPGRVDIVSSGTEVEQL